jgi:hypothetical protein
MRLEDEAAYKAGTKWTFGVLHRLARVIVDSPPEGIMSQNGEFPKARFKIVFRREVYPARGGRGSLAASDAQVSAAHSDLI